MIHVLFLRRISSTTAQHRVARAKAQRYRQNAGLCRATAALFLGPTRFYFPWNFLYIRAGSKPAQLTLHVIILIPIRPIIYQRPRVRESGLPISISTRWELSRRTLAAVIIFSAIGPGEARRRQQGGYTMVYGLRWTRRALWPGGAVSGDSKVSRAKPSVPTSAVRWWAPARSRTAVASTL
jgi:hypothetical protein